ITVMYQYEQDVLGASYFGPVAGSPLVPPEVVTIYFVVFFFILAVVYFILHQKRKPVHIKHKVQLLVVTALVLKLFVVIGGGFVAAYWLVPRPGIQSITPLDNSKGHEVTKKLEIIFDRPVSRNDLSKQISTYVTQDPPSVISITPKNGDSDIEIGNNIRVELTQPNDRVSEFDFSV